MTLMSGSSLLTVLILGCAALFFVHGFVVDIWAGLRSYRRERHWEIRAQQGDATAAIIIRIRDQH